MNSHLQPPIIESMQFKDTKLSMYSSFSDQKPKTISIEELVQMIRDGQCKAEIEQLRSASGPSIKDKIKRGLPAVTTSGLFNGSRKANDLIKYSGLVQIDFDKLASPNEEFKVLSGDPYTMAAFISPSGTGLKLIVKIEGGENCHKSNFLTLQQYYLTKYGLGADPSCKDLSRLMFLSYDPDIYFNPESEIWGPKKAFVTTFDQIVTFVSKKIGFSEGNRNQFVFKLGIEAKARVLAIENVIQECISRFRYPDFEENEIRRTIESAYSYPSNSINKNRGTQYSKISSIEAKILEWYDLRCNEIASRIEYKPAGSSEPYKELNENSLWRRLASENMEISMNKLSTLLRSDFVPHHHPFKEYYSSLGAYNEQMEPDYIGELCTYIQCIDQKRFNTQFRKMLVRVVACALEPGVFNKQAFILVQDKQNSGKSTFCRWLCPPRLLEYIAENISTDKDSLIALTTNLLINLDELATLSKTEINNLKSFFSQDMIKVRLPYDRKATSRPRCASFIGSTNQDEFLTDETGSVRWLCFRIDYIDFNYKININIDDLWRQAYHLYLKGFAYQLTPEEIRENELANKDFQKLTIEREFIERHFSPGTKEDCTHFVQAMDIQKCAQETGVKLLPVQIGKALKLLGFARSAKYKGPYQVKGYYVKLNSSYSFTCLTREP